MVKVSSSIKINTGKILQLTQEAVTALEQTGEALHTEVVQAQVVPRDTGDLQNKAFFVDHASSKSGRVTLVFDTPYARRLYFHPEYNFSKLENPNAQGKWLEPWTPGGIHQNFCRNTFMAFYKRRTGV